MLGVKHSGQLGDIVYALPFVKAFIARYGFEKVVLFIPSDKQAHRPRGLNHMAGDLMVSAGMFSFIEPLLLSQSYIEKVLYIAEEKIPSGILDLDLMRSGLVNLNAGNIRSNYFKVFGLMDFDVGPWLNFSEKEHGVYFDIVIGRSCRYINDSIDYNVLAEIACVVGFIGTDDEFGFFKIRYPKLKLIRVEIKNALQAAFAIKKSRLYLGNQSLFFALAEAMQHPRILESFEPVPNVIPTSGASGSFLTTGGMVSMVAQFLGVDVERLNIEHHTPQYKLSV